jgi:hypothetical protein
MYNDTSPFSIPCGLYYDHILTIVNDASTINVIDDASLALASVVNYDRK